MHLIGAGYDILTVQELLGHPNVSTEMFYTHVPNQGGREICMNTSRFIDSQNMNILTQAGGWHAGLAAMPRARDEFSNVLQAAHQVSRYGYIDDVAG